MSRLRGAHLVRRWATALSRRPPSPGDVEVVRGVLTEPEFQLWTRMRVEDRRHSIEVLERFVVLAPDSTRAERAAALLHDVGKLDSDLGVTARVIATIVGPRGTRFRRYHDHEAIGAAMLRELGTDPVTIELVEGQGPRSASLAAADDV